MTPFPVSKWHTLNESDSLGREKKTNNTPTSGGPQPSRGRVPFVPGTFFPISVELNINQSGTSRISRNSPPKRAPRRLPRHTANQIPLCVLCLSGCLSPNKGQKSAMLLRHLHWILVSLQWSSPFLFSSSPLPVNQKSFPEGQKLSRPQTVPGTLPRHTGHRDPLPLG